MRKLRSFAALPPGRRTLLLRAWLALAWARLELSAVPFRRVAKRAARTDCEGRDDNGRDAEWFQIRFHF